MVAMESNPVDRLAGQMMTTATKCMWMRGGTSKGGYFLGVELPADSDARDAFLLRVMGSPDARQIDGMGGGTPLTSKVAIVDRSVRSDADIDYLFLQVFVDQASRDSVLNMPDIVFDAKTGRKIFVKRCATTTQPGAGWCTWMTNCRKQIGV